VKVSDNQKKGGSRKDSYGQRKMMIAEARKVYPWVTDEQVKCRAKRMKTN
jgi:hypothetical protein